MTREHPEDWRNKAADRAAGAATNIAMAALNEEPAGTLSTASTVVKHVVFGGCDCSCKDVCSACDDGPGAA